MRLNNGVMEPAAPTPDTSSLSKRAARRLIQRAFVLASRDRVLRQHIRQTRLTTLWILEDWKLVWTVTLERGKLEFERRPARNPGLILAWPTAAAFFRQAESATRARAWASADTDEAGENVQPEIQGDRGLLRLLEPVFYAFCAALRAVLANPVDENGDPLV